MINRKINMFSYAILGQGVGISALFWDYQNNNLLAGTTDGKLLSLENGQFDTKTDGSAVGVSFTAVTQQWTVPSDTVLENVSALVGCSGPIELISIMDGLPTGTATLTSTSSTTGGPTRSWVHVPLGGTFANSLAFSIMGTQLSAASQDGFYQLNFDLLPEPTKMVFYRTPYDDKSYEADKKWDVAYFDLDQVGAGTVTAVTFVDSVAVMTNTLTATSSTGRRVVEAAFPAEIYGRVAFTTYTTTSTFTQTLTSGTSTTSGTGTVQTYTNVGPSYFKHWRTYYDARNEPPKINYWRTDIESLEENICDAFDVDINPNGTATGTWFIDNVAQGTGTYTGTVRQSYTQNVPASQQYGRTLYVVYTGTGLKHYKTWYHLRREPDRWSYWVSDRQSEQEEIWDAIETDIDCLGNTVLGTLILDGTVITTATLSGTERHSFVTTIPEETYGRTIRVVYVAQSGRFKHYKTWYSSRKEPDRLTSYVTDRISLDEHEWKVYKPALNCLGGTVLCTAFIDEVAIATYTATGTERIQYTFSLPPQTFGRTVHAAYAVATAGQFFKHYTASGLNLYTRDIEYEGTQEPPRVWIWRTGPNPFLSSQYLKTWSVLLDPLNNVVSGTLTVDDIAIATCTFTGNKRQWFTVGLDIDASNVVSTGSRWEALYNTPTPTGDFDSKFKHYDTKLETEPKPYGKDRWAYSYRKLGGASQIDLARFWSIEAECAAAQAPLPIEYFWDIDGANFTSGTITLSGGVQWIDRISLPPGGRGYIFLFRCTSTNSGTFQSGPQFKINKVNLDFDQEGIKGLVRRETPGTPQGNS